MASFKGTNAKIFSKLEPELTEEAAYWKKLEAPALLKEFGPIDYIDFNPVEPFNFAVTCSVRVQIYNPVTKAIVKNLNRFKETAYGGKFRQDGKLLCAGGDEAQIKLFDVGSKSLLRVFSGHTGAVHRCFFTTDGTHLFSCSDDKTTAIWDLPSETVVTKYDNFSDYVRAGAVSPVSTDLVLAGSYDKRVTLIDCRTNVPVLIVDHGAPVESVMFAPSGGLFISAGGTEVCVWDALAGGRLLARLSPHHKTVTCLAIASGGNRLLTGGLDQFVRVIDMTSMQPIHNLSYPAPILSLGVAPKDGVLAVGMVDGLVSVARRLEPALGKPKIPKHTRLFGKPLPPDPIIKFKVDADVIVAQKEEKSISNCDQYIRAFRYSKAVDVAVMSYNQKRKPEMAVAVFQELIRRKGVHSALAGRKEDSLVPIVKFICKYIGEFEFTPTLIDVANIFLEVYGDKLHEMPKVAHVCESLLRLLNDEERFTQNLLELQGALNMLQSAASCVQPPPRTIDLEPSDATAAAVLELRLS